MSERTDSRIKSNQLLLGVVIVLLSMVAGGAFLILQKMGSPAVLEKTDTQDEQSIAQQILDEGPLTATLTYPAGGMLSSSTVTITSRYDAQSLALETLNALFADQRSVQTAVLGDLKLRALYIDSAGIAYLDLSPSRQESIRASAWEEYLAIYAMVNTLMGNFGEVRQVRFLVDGREARTLAGHIDLSGTFTKRMDLVRQS